MTLIESSDPGARCSTCLALCLILALWVTTAWAGPPRVSPPRAPPMEQAELMGLLQRLQHSDPQQRMAALRKLAAYRGKAQVVLAALARSLVDPNQVVRFLAARQIIRWGPGALAYMRPALGHADKKVRWSAAFALSRIQPKTAAIRSVLLTLLRNTSYRARGAAILGLHDGKKVSSRVWQALARQLTWDVHPINRIYCMRALITHPRRAQPLLLRAMAADRHPLVRRKAAALLVASALPKKPIDAALRRGLAQERDDVVRLGFLLLWGQLQQRRQANVAAAIPLLRTLMKAKLWTLREAAIQQAGLLGAAGRALRPALRRSLQDSRPEVRAAASRALDAIPASRPTSRPTSRPRSP